MCGVRTNEDGVRTNDDGVRTNEDGFRTNEDGVRTNGDGVRTNDDEFPLKIKMIDFQLIKQSANWFYCFSCLNCDFCDRYDGVNLFSAGLKLLDACLINCLNLIWKRLVGKE